MVEPSRAGFDDVVTHWQSSLSGCATADLLPSRWQASARQMRLVITTIEIRAMMGAGVGNTWQPRGALNRAILAKAAVQCSKQRFKFFTFGMPDPSRFGRIKRVHRRWGAQGLQHALPRHRDTHAQRTRLHEHGHLPKFEFN
jgi:hypothetical protein